MSPLCCGLMQICGGPGVEGCSGCSEALCGENKCGGPNCEGVLPISQKALSTAERTKERFITLPSSMELFKNKAGIHWRDR